MKPIFLSFHTDENKNLKLLVPKEGTQNMLLKTVVAEIYCYLICDYHIEIIYRNKKPTNAHIIIIVKGMINNNKGDSKNT